MSVKIRTKLFHVCSSTCEDTLPKPLHWKWLTKWKGQHHTIRVAKYIDLSQLGSQKAADGTHPNGTMEESLIKGLFTMMCSEFMETKEGWDGALSYHQLRATPTMDPEERTRSLAAWKRSPSESMALVKDGTILRQPSRKLADGTSLGLPSRAEQKQKKCGSGRADGEEPACPPAFPFGHPCYLDWSK